MDNHADKRAHDDKRFDFNHGAVTLTLANVAAEKVVERPHGSFPKHVGQLVPLKGRMQQQAVKLHVAFIMLESAEGKSLKNSLVVFARDSVRDHLAGVKGRITARFVVEKRAIEFFLGGKVTKDHCFGYACRLCDFPGRRAAEPFLRKE